MKKLVVFIMLVFLSVAPRAALSFFPDYGPFDKGENPKNWPLNECRIFIKNTSINYSDFADEQGNDLKNNINSILLAGTKSRLKAEIAEREINEEKVNGIWEKGIWPCLDLTINRGKTITFFDYPNWQSHYDSIFQLLDNVYTTDLNKDRRDDYILFTNYPARFGMDNDTKGIIFVISSDNGYCLVRFEDFAPEPGNFINIDGNFVMVTTEFLRWERSTDGRNHTYFLYNLYKFNGGKFELANELDSRFPKIVMYTFKENHKETRLLTKKQKENIYKETPKFFGN